MKNLIGTILIGIIALVLVAIPISYIGLGIWFNTHVYHLSEFTAQFLWVVYFIGMFAGMGAILGSI
jgi:peptidoglycan biosynthesis protein MviN/MurJ (putative lipid II flippase)